MAYPRRYSWRNAGLEVYRHYHLTPQRKMNRAIRSLATDEQYCTCRSHPLIIVILLDVVLFEMHT